MSYLKLFSNLKRSKSLTSIKCEGRKDLFTACLKTSRSVSESSECVLHDDFLLEKGFDDEVIGLLEEKIDRLSDLFLEQCKLMTEIREEIRSSNAVFLPTQNKVVTELMKKVLEQSSSKVQELVDSDETSEFNSRARSLLDAIQIKRAFCLEREVRDSLVEFLQSEDLKERMVSATVEALKDMIQGNFSQDLSSVYLPMLERSHRRLAKNVTRVLEEAFTELEEHSASFSTSIYKISRSLRRALERHQWLMEDVAETSKTRLAYLQRIVEEVLQKEMEQWHQHVLQALCDYSSERDENEDYPSLDCVPPSPPQPADPKSSIIDQLMQSAVINKKIQDGDINGSFMEALSAGDLSLVMAACRAADPSRVFAPCRLQQPVLLSLAQQLPTDMVHDTHLKCRYLEETLINLNPSDPATRTHLPLVVGEVCKHLNDFISKYPSHVACRRITLIIMAADNLLK